MVWAVGPEEWQSEGMRRSEPSEGKTALQRQRCSPCQPRLSSAKGAPHTSLGQGPRTFPANFPEGQRPVPSRSTGYAGCESVRTDSTHTALILRLTERGQNGTSSRSSTGGGRASVGKGRPEATKRFKMSSRSIKRIWLLLVASSRSPIQFFACFVISPPATMM